MHGLGNLASHPNIDPFVIGIPIGNMFELIQVKISVQLAIEHREHVQVELCGDTLGIVVRRPQPIRILDQVGSQQEGAARFKGSDDVGDESFTSAWFEVSNGAAQERHHAGAADWHERDVTVEVAHDAVHRYAGIVVADIAGSRSQHLFADIEWHITFEHISGGHCIEQDSALLTGSRSKLDQRVCTSGGHNLAGTSVQDLSFSTERVVLVEFRDLIEQLAAQRVVEPLRRDKTIVGRESGAHVIFERGTPPVRLEMHIDTYGIHEKPLGGEGSGAPA